MADLEAVIFDWGGTLSVWTDADIGDMWGLAARHIASAHHPGGAREEEVLATLIRVEEESWERTRGDCRSTRLADLLAEASRRLEVDIAGVVLEEAAAHHLDSWTPHIRHHPDAVPTLARLRDAGLKIGLLSNTHWPRHFHEHFLERDGLIDLIDARLYTSEMPMTKPHPEAFQQALDALGVRQASRAAFVGDRLYDDVFGAHRAGLRAVWVRNDTVPSHDVEPDAVVDRLSQLPAVLLGVRET